MRLKSLVNCVIGVTGFLLVIIGQWKTWKVIEFRNFIFQAWKVMEVSCGPVKYKGLQMRRQGQCKMEISH